jgi:Cu(I)/Ag(I) efflux system protein CusF
MKTAVIKILVVTAMTSLAFNAWADHHEGSGKGHEHMDHSMQQRMDGDAMAPTLTQGEVRAISKEKQRITLKHGEIKNLNMAAMTMAFAVKDPAMLDQVKVGDKIEFKAVKDRDTLMLVEIRLKK